MLLPSVCSPIVGCRRCEAAACRSCQDSMGRHRQLTEGQLYEVLARQICPCRVNGRCFGLQHAVLAMLRECCVLCSALVRELTRSELTGVPAAWRLRPPPPRHLGSRRRGRCRGSPALPHRPPPRLKGPHLWRPRRRHQWRRGRTRAREGRSAATRSTATTVAMAARPSRLLQAIRGPTEAVAVGRAPPRIRRKL